MVPRDDLYKSGTIHTGQGEPANSVSRPTPRPKQIPGKPITNGKLLRPGGPKGGPSKSSRPAPAARPTPQARPIPQPAAATQQNTPAQQQPVQQQPAAAMVNGIGHNRNESASSIGRAVPPPPPPPPPAAAPAGSKKDIFRVLYDFEGQTASEMSLKKGERLEIVRKEGNGKALGNLLLLTPRY